MGFLRQGREFNESIEGGTRRGPNGDRLAQNIAIAQLESGRLDSAIRQLLRVRQDAREGSLVSVVAGGYLALLDRLGGHVTALDARFEVVTAALERHGEQRAQALFSLHHARLLFGTDQRRALDLLARAKAISVSTTTRAFTSSCHFRFRRPGPPIERAILEVSLPELASLRGRPRRFWLRGSGQHPVAAPGMAAVPATARSIDDAEGTIATLDC